MAYDALHRREGGREDDSGINSSLNSLREDMANRGSGRPFRKPESAWRIGQKTGLGWQWRNGGPGCRRDQREQQGAPGHAGGSGALGSGLGRTGAGALCFA